MYQIKFIHISLLPRMDGTETIIRKYFMLVWHHKRRPKEVNNCYTYQHKKGKTMVN